MSSHDQVRLSTSTPPPQGTIPNLGTVPVKGLGYIKGPMAPIASHHGITPDNEEKMLREKIATLCEDEKQKRDVLKDKTDEVSPFRSDLKATRTALAMNLSKMKELLAGTGRDGHWHPFLKQNKLSRSTADRLVKQHRARESQIANGSLVDTHEPTEAEVQMIANSLLSKCRRLTTKKSVDVFIVKLEMLLHAQTKEQPASPSIPTPPPSAPPQAVWEENEL